MSDQMNDIMNRAVEAETGGQLEAGMMIEVDDDDLAQVAGGVSKEYYDRYNSRGNERRPRTERPSDKRRKKAWE